MERRPIRVLHVEDNEFFATVASDILQQELDDVEVHTENAPCDALSRLKEEQFDCVVSDYEMPGMNGLELLDAVREIRSELPFILMTGGGSENTASRAISAGVTDYLQKGDGRRQFVALANRIENAVAHRRAEKAVRRQITINDLIWDVSQSLLEASTREDIEQSVCERLADSESYLFAWVGKVEDGCITPRFSAGTEAGYLDAVFRTDAEENESKPVSRALETGDPISRALETGEIQTAQDIAGDGFSKVDIPGGTDTDCTKERQEIVRTGEPETSDSSLEHWREKALERGYHSKAAIPLRYENSLYGVLNVYADHPHAFDETERQVLSKFGNSMAYAINSVRTRQELVRREQRLQVFNRILRHNLRNDLNVVLGHADNIKEAVPGAAKSAEIIKRKATELINISEKAREVGKTLDRSGQTGTAVEITSIIERACSDLQESYPNVVLSTELPNTAWVYGDKTLNTVVNEVVENAIEHNDRDDPVVTLSVTAVDSERENWTEIIISDNGPGIPKEEQLVLIEGRETALQHGSGLGLWLTNWVVGKFDGELTFGTNEPRGSVVTIRLRRAESPSR
ncbi:GAF domain-containing protein [Haladaptatus litoreus]|uniref:GAF domain-containing protein n=1 Tax=Haladaptatus litoreus TaxID=553468 RepID=A0A1N7DXT6_9EURY|nr:response regulator [Haladaptatus litoreus]SIR80644.1 GAF domain-containing protein [Haladaptatus litoreus]